MPLAVVSPRDIQEAIDERCRHAEPDTVARDFAALRAMLNSAVNADVIGRSPARKVALPRIVRQERTTIDPLQLRRLVDEVPEHYRALVLTAGVLGLAWEEAIALRVRDVDFMRRTVSVAQTVEGLAGHHRIVPEGNGKARLRTMSAPVFVVDAIANHLATSRTQIAPDPDALIFLGPRGGILRRRFWGADPAPCGCSGRDTGSDLPRSRACCHFVPGRYRRPPEGHGVSYWVRHGQDDDRDLRAVERCRGSRSRDAADREAARLLQERFAAAFETDVRRQPRTGRVGYGP